MNILQIFDVTGFAAEYDIGAAEKPGRMHAAQGEIIGIAYSIVERQFNNQVDMSDSCFRTGELISDGDFPALCKVARHDCDDDVGARQSSGSFDMVDVSVMNGLYSVIKDVIIIYETPFLCIIIVTDAEEFIMCCVKKIT